jgi:hypothetical protein
MGSKCNLVDATPKHRRARLFRGELRVHAYNFGSANCASIPGPQQDGERRWHSRVNAMRPRGFGAQMQPSQ